MAAPQPLESTHMRSDLVRVEEEETGQGTALMTMVSWATFAAHISFAVPDVPQSSPMRMWARMQALSDGPRMPSLSDTPPEHILSQRLHRVHTR